MIGAFSSFLDFSPILQLTVVSASRRFTESIEESNFSSTIDLLANCAIFIYLGATMPFDAWNNEYTTLTPWRLVLLCLGILTLRRLPGLYALQWWIPDIKTRREAIFAGHFGPMGVGAIFIVRLSLFRLAFSSSYFFSHSPLSPPKSSLHPISHPKTPSRRSHSSLLPSLTASSSAPSSVLSPLSSLPALCSS
jgi:NhaP-type Na+/H+ or K+/H+ antiporter